jgi:pantoate--beta-alanine ligase
MFALNFNKITMQIFNKNIELREFLASEKSKTSTIGFVPTMGALHDGHLALISQSLQENNSTVVSIFVNPTQFNNPEDLAKYPRTLEADVKKLATLSDEILIYAPTVEDIYEGKTIAESYDYDGLEHQMEGKFRPGHFDGVGTIVKRLFEIVAPTRAYFGEKDFQQLQIVKKLVEKNHIPVEIIGCPIHREPSGLAMSSRNERLSDTERKEAAIIFKILNEAKEKFKTQDADLVEDWVKEAFKKHPLFELEYFIIADESALIPIILKEKSKKYRAFIAVIVNNIRLIDTITLN